jgi:hypothetical protein
VGRWTGEEDSTLKDAVEKHNGEDWAAISKLVPGRTKSQCWCRWDGSLACKSGETIARVGKWTTEGEDWADISALVLGRTNRQCLNRWHNALESETDEETNAWVEEVTVWTELG